MSVVERNFVFSTKSKQLEHVPFVLTLWKRRNFTIKSFDVVAVGNKVECCFYKVERCFDIVAGVDGALAMVVHVTAYDAVTMAPASG